MSNGNGHSWSKFSWRDWRGDPALHPCSLAARGFWMEVLCMMHEGCPVGHLTIGGKPATIRQMAANAGCSDKEATRYLAELEEAGVFSRTPDGTIYSRRMVKDAVASEVGRENAAKRWNGGKPTDPPNGVPNAKANGEATGHPIGQAFRDPNAKNLESKKEDKEPPRSPPVTGGVARRGRNSRNAFHDLAREMDAEEGLIVIDGTAEVADLSAFRQQVKGVGYG